MKGRPAWLIGVVTLVGSVTTATTLSLLIVYFTASYYLPHRLQEIQAGHEERLKKAVLVELQDFQLPSLVSQIGSAPELAATYGPLKYKFTCVDAHLERIKQEKTLDALLSAFRSCDESFAKTFSPFKHLSEGLRFGAFLTLVSSRVAPYGASEALVSNQAPLAIVKNVLGASSLTCAEQMLLVSNALKLAYPHLDVAQVGIVNSEINHAIVFASDSSGALLLDPTTSVVVAEQLQDVLKGEPVNVYRMIDYYEGNDELLEQFRRKLRGALRNGGIRNEDIAYKYGM
jgi:hypothetical protein